MDLLRPSNSAESRSSESCPSAKSSDRDPSAKEQSWSDEIDSLEIERAISRPQDVLLIKFAAVVCAKKNEGAQRVQIVDILIKTRRGSKRLADLTES